MPTSSFTGQWAWAECNDMERDTRRNGFRDWNTAGRDLNSSMDSAKSCFERFLTWQGNPRLKVGNVKEKDADTVVIETVAKDDSLVRRFVVNRHDGHFQPSEADNDVE